MTLLLDLPPDLEARINSEAARRGVPLTACVLEILDAATTSGPMPTGEVTSDPSDETGAKPPIKTLTGAQIVAKWRRKGLIGTRPDIKDSVAFVQEMRRKAAIRDWS